MSSAGLAWQIHDEVLMRFLVTLLWRQRNIRECRIGTESEGANLFKARLHPMNPIAVPTWAAEMLRRDPHTELWQFHFRPAETKTAHEVRSILPRRLVPMLEEYLQHHRPVLLNGDAPCTLFLNREGRPLTLSQLTNLVGELTLRSCGRRVTPHLVRDSFAFYWLDNHPEDYLTISKMLWHRNINTTLRIYGARFDESHGLRRVEEWLDRQ